MICSVADCLLDTYGRKEYCQKHYTRFVRHGDPVVVKTRYTDNPPKYGPDNHLWLGDEIGYLAAHKRVVNEHGKAAEWPCSANCGAQAGQWAYMHDSPKERVGNHRGYQVAFSPDPADYVPLCVPCHKTFDLARG